MSLAPISLFTYIRVNSLKDTVSTLKKNFLANESELHIFSDGSKNEDDLEQVKLVREFLKSISGFKTVTIYESDKNNGLANSIIEGTTKIINKHGKIIVLEDDLLTTPNFLNFMNDALNKYESESRVFSISGYSFNLGLDKVDINNDAYFLNRGWSWGWATWAQRWQQIDWKVKDYKEFSNAPKQRKLFSKGGSDLNAMLDKQMKGKLDSWAIRWFFYQFKLNGYTLYPYYSKVYYNGFDEYATHTNGSSARYIPMLDKKHNTNFIFPSKIAINKNFQSKFQSKMGIMARIKSKVKTLFKKYIK